MRGLTTSLMVLCVAARAFAQPQSDAPPPGSPDYEGARRRYDAGSQAMDDGRFADAVDEFKAAYDITRDAVLFYKLATASEKAVEQAQPNAKLAYCMGARLYYNKYIAEAKPEPKFQELARAGLQRLEQLCPSLPQRQPNEPRPPDKTTEIVSGADAPPPTAPVPPTTPTPPPAEPPSKNKDRAWLFVGGSLAFVTAGAVLAYSVGSSEQDIKDLYVSNNGGPPPYNEETQRRYDELVAEGKRYEYLAWTSFGLAAGCAIGATIFFVRDRKDVSVAPIVTPKQTGVAATLRF